MSETDAPDDPRPDEAPDLGAPDLGAVRRRERRVLTILGVLLAVGALVVWLTIPSDETLLERAYHHEDPETRVEAAQALVVRGYWMDRSPEEILAFLEGVPENVRVFLRDAHPALARAARPARVRREAAQK